MRRFGFGIDGQGFPHLLQVVKVWCVAVWPTTLSLSAVDGKRTITFLIYIYILFVERERWMDGWMDGWIDR